MLLFYLPLLTKIPKKGIPNVTFLCDSKSSLHPIHFLEIFWSGSKTRRSNAIEMSEKYQKRPLSKNEDTTAVRHFEESNFQGDNPHANSNITDQSVQRL